VLDRVAERAIRIARYARRLGLRVLYEPQGMYFNGSDGFRGLYRRIKAECPEVGVCADVGNPMFVDEDPVRFIKEFACEALHVHVKDYRGSDGNGDRTRGGRFLMPARIGTGEAHVSECIAALKAVGYAGYYAVEAYGMAEITASARMINGA
jgi:sugar phosphate isomerase/epimerase